MILPKKDKNGNGYLSYSQIALFKRDRAEYLEQYIIGKKFEGNAYTDFGSNVGNALETNNFEKFTKDEAVILQKATRLDEFERRTILKYDGFYIVGYIDTNKKDYSKIIDYKTGGLKKESQYKDKDYTQLHLYALSLRQETGITPKEASVEFIRRAGNAFRGEKLTVANENPIKIDIDISYNRLKSVYWETLEVAKEIETFYKLSK